MPDRSSLFRPLRAGALLLPNRLVMAPMTRNRAGADGVPTPLMAQYYAQRASAGLVVTEGTAVAPDGYAAPLSPGLHDDAQERGWRAVADAVHGAGGRLVVQLFHAGRASHPDLLGGRTPVAPSAVAAAADVFTPSGPAPAAMPRPLTAAQIASVTAAFASAARRAVRAGADGVEVHAGNGFLLDQFLSADVNRRDDAYGRDRARLAGEVIGAVAAAIGAQRVGVRTSPGGTYNDMGDPAPAATLAALTAVLPADLAYLHVILGALRPAEARRHWPGVLIANGPADRAYDDVDGAGPVGDGGPDALSFGRAFLANPDLPARLAQRAPLAVPDASTFYGGGPEGYVDYPRLDEQTLAA